MKNYLSVTDLSDPKAFVAQALRLKSQPNKKIAAAAGRCLGMVFFNPSLRTRLSSIRAAQLLGLDVFDQTVASGWPLEFSPNAVMNQDKSEHIEEAAAVLSQYCDILAIRAFPSLNARDADYSEPIMSSFLEHGSVPILNLESATRHPLQGLADMMTIAEHQKATEPKVVLSWAPHPKALPHSVSNSFVSWCRALGHNLTITNPPGYDLSPEIVGDIPIEHDQEKALADADFVYTKNWSAYEDYGAILDVETDWQITPDKMARTNQGCFMHCLPVRRNVIVSSEVLRSDGSLVIEQANNRTFAAYAVLRQLIENGEWRMENGEW